MPNNFRVEAIYFGDKPASTGWISSILDSTLCIIAKAKQNYHRMKPVWMTCDFASALVGNAPEAVERQTTDLFFKLMNSQAVSHLKRLAHPEPDRDPDITQWTPGILKFQVYVSALSAVTALFKAQLPARGEVITLIEASPFRQTVRLDLSQSAAVLEAQLQAAIATLQPE